MTRLPVMIVVDNPQQATELSALVKKNGYTVAAIVSGGEDPVKRSSAEKPALVLMDLVIPGRPDGIAVAEPLSARHKDPVIFIVNSPEEARRAQVQHPGRYGFISRPLDERELIIALELAQYRHDADKKLSVSHNELKKYRVHLEAMIARRTEELRKTNAQLQRLLHFIELTERKLATDASVAGKLAASLQSLASSGTAGERLGNIPVQSRSGNALVMESYAEPIFDTDGQRVGVVFTFRNAAESRKKEYEALRTQKLESLNLMVRGVAHDFNNILSSVLANICTVEHLNPHNLYEPVKVRENALT